jgi:hypothetical protein
MVALRRLFLFETPYSCRHSDSLEGNFTIAMNGLVVLRDRLGIVVPTLFSAFDESACSSTLTLALHHCASLVLSLNALGAVVMVSEERNHVDLLLLGGDLDSGVDSILISLV